MGHIDSTQSVNAPDLFAQVAGFLRQWYRSTFMIATHRWAQA